MRKPFVAGNWKMNTDSSSSVELAERIASGAMEAATSGSLTVAVCPPFVYLQSMAKPLAHRALASAPRMFTMNRRVLLPAR